MTPYEIVIVASLFLVVVVLAVWNFATLKNELKHTRERLAKLEEAQDSPIGYNQMQAFDELTAYLVGIEKRCEIAREIANASKRGKWRAQKKD